MSKSLYRIVGMKYRNSASFVRDLMKRGTHTAILLEREPDNQFDSNAVKVIIYNKHVGYIIREQAIGLAAEMDMRSLKQRSAKLIDDRGFPSAELDEKEVS